MRTAVYEHAVEYGHVEATCIGEVLGLPVEVAERAIAELTEDHLLIPCPQGEGGGHAPRSPETALAHLVGQLEAEIRQRRTEADRIHARLAPFTRIYGEVTRRSTAQTSVEVLDSLSAIRSALGRLATSARAEVAGAHPVVPPPEALEDGLLRTRETLDRGVRMRTLYPHSALAHPHMRRHFSMMSELGAEIRTTDRISDRIIVFDQKTAVLSSGPRDTESEKSGEAAPPPNATVVSEASIVLYLYHAWEDAWVAALPFSGSVSGFGYGDAKKDIKRSIARLLESGLKDEVVARRLGMSVRACRGHIAEIMEELNAESRFQAGSRARREGWFEE